MLGHESRIELSPNARLVGRLHHKHQAIPVEHASKDPLLAWRNPPFDLCRQIRWPATYLKANIRRLARKGSGCHHAHFSRRKSSVADCFRDRRQVQQLIRFGDQVSTVLLQRDFYFRDAIQASKSLFQALLSGCSFHPERDDGNLFQADACLAAWRACGSYAEQGQHTNLFPHIETP